MSESLAQQQDGAALEAMARALYEGHTLPDRIPWGDLAHAMKRQWVEEIRERAYTKEEKA